MFIYCISFQSDLHGQALGQVGNEHLNVDALLFVQIMFQFYVRIVQV